jgi:hypothetical protein
LSELTITTVGVFVVLLAVVIAWSPLARGMIRESVIHPNQPCTLRQTSRQHVVVTRKSLPEKPQNVGEAEQGSKELGKNFKFAMAATVIITILCLIAIVALAFAHTNAQVTAASGTCEKGFIFGFSALIGLIGGKALN